MKITGVGRAALMALGIAILAGCGKQDAQETDMQREIGTYRAQDGTLSEHLYVTEEGYVQGFTGQEDTCDFQITVAEDGFYDLKFRAAGLGGYKENRILVDDISVGNLVSSAKEFEEKVIKRNFLSAGEHKITVEGYWGYITLDSLTVLESKELAEDREPDVTLSNPDAGECARRLMSYFHIFNALGGFPSPGDLSVSSYLSYGMDHKKTNAKGGRGQYRSKKVVLRITGIDWGE